MGGISSVDTNGNGLVTIKEAKAAGFSMSITSDHPYMRILFFICLPPYIYYKNIYITNKSNRISLTAHGIDYEWLFFISNSSKLLDIF